MITSKSTNLQRCSMLVLDEADRMFDMGFEQQVPTYARRPPHLKAHTAYIYTNAHGYK
jgi:superfamily II DNA/RNA helicase